MSGFFITKKQKKIIKDRRRKAKVFNTSGTTVSKSVDRSLVSESSLTKEQEQLSTLSKEEESNGKKRPRSYESVEEETTQHTTNAQSKLVSTKITIPDNLSAKEAKKFRKDARRTLRLEMGHDKFKIQFVVQGQETKKVKRTFPRINELLQQEKIQAQQRDKNEQDDNLSEEYKSRYVALDCEMVGIGTDGKKSALARVSMVDWWGKTLLDTFVQVPTHVTDFRTFVSGVKPKDLRSADAMDVVKCRELVSALLKDKILVGHALHNDLSALMLQHPITAIRDTAKYRPFQRLHKMKWRPRKLRDLVHEHCNQKRIQVSGEAHDSVEDAKANMELFQTVHAEWEKELELKAVKKQRKR